MSVVGDKHALCTRSPLGRAVGNHPNVEGVGPPSAYISRQPTFSEYGRALLQSPSRLSSLLPWLSPFMRPRSRLMPSPSCLGLSRNPRFALSSCLLSLATDTSIYARGLSCLGYRLPRYSTTCELEFLVLRPIANASPYMLPLLVNARALDLKSLRARRTSTLVQDTVDP